MTATHPSESAPTIVLCELSASSAAEATLEYAYSYCKARDYELVVLRVVDPELLPSAPGGGPGTFGLLGAMALALDAVRRHDPNARVVVRVGERGRVLEEERCRLGAERVITPADVPPERCPMCGARYDARALHFCPAAHRGPVRRADVEPSAA